MPSFAAASLPRDIAHRSIRPGSASCPRSSPHMRVRRDEVRQYQRRGKCVSIAQVLRRRCTRGGRTSRRRCAIDTAGLDDGDARHACSAAARALFPRRVSPTSFPPSARAFNFRRRVSQDPPRPCASRNIHADRRSRMSARASDAVSTDRPQDGQSRSVRPRATQGAVGSPPGRSGLRRSSSTARGCRISSASANVWGRASVARGEVFRRLPRLAKAAFADSSLVRKHRLTLPIRHSPAAAQMVISRRGHARFRETEPRPASSFRLETWGIACSALVEADRSRSADRRRATPPELAELVAHRTNDRCPIRRRSPMRWTRCAHNFERLVRSRERAAAHGPSIDDDSIRRRIRHDYRHTGTVLCPHSAVAVEAYWRLDPSIRAQRTWIAAATAHPYKFAEVVEPLIGETLQPPPALAAILGRQSNTQAMAAPSSPRQALETSKEGSRMSRGRIPSLALDPRTGFTPRWLAPLAKCPTSRAYLAKAPVASAERVTAGAGRDLRSASVSITRASTSMRMLSPLSSRPIGPPRAASGETWPTMNP